MMVLPAVVDGSQMDLFVILQDDNIERIKQHDPAEVVHKHMGAFAKYAIRNVIIGYATPEDLATVMPMLENGDLQGALKHLSRGFRYRPDKGDHDAGYESALRRQ